MSLLEHPDAQALLADAVVTPEQVRGCQDRLTDLPATLPAPLLPRRAADQRHPRHPRPAQRPAAQDLRADRRRGRRPPQAGPELRRRRQVGRRGRHGRAAPPRPRGAGRPAGGPDPRPQRLPQVGDRVVRRGPAVVRPAGQAGQLPARRLPRLRRPRRVRAAGPPALPARGLGRRRRTAARSATSPRTSTFQESWRIAVDLLERCRKDLPHAWVTGDDELGRPARVPRLAAAARRAVRARRALQHERPRPGVPAPPAAACRPGPQAGGAVLPRRRLGGAATGVRGGPG